MNFFTHDGLYNRPRIHFRRVKCTSVLRAALLYYAAAAAPVILKNYVLSNSLLITVEPMMFVPHQLLGSPLGGTLILECLTEAHPRPITFWTRTDANNVNGIMLLPSKRLQLDTLLVGYQTQMRLHIHQVEAQDIGHYKCVSKNSLGEAEGSIRVYGIL